MLSAVGIQRNLDITKLYVTKSSVKRTIFLAPVKESRVAAARLLPGTAIRHRFPCRPTKVLVASDWLTTPRFLYCVKKTLNQRKISLVKEKH